MARVYHRDQTGAYSNLNGGNVPSQGFAVLKEVLKSCLVYGYNSQPAAGWELISEGSAYLILRNGSHSGYVCFTLSGNQLRIYLSATYSGVVSNIIQGDGVKTGLAANNSSPQALFCRYWFYSGGASTWYMVADAKTFVLYVTTYYEVLDLRTNNISENHAIYVGEDSAGNFISIGGFNSASANFNYFSSAGFTALTNPATGLLVGSGSLSILVPGMGSGFVETDSIVVPDVDFGRACWFGGGVYAGKLRGIAVPSVHQLCSPGSLAKRLGFSGTFTTRTANTPINLGDGYSWFVGVGYSCTGHLATDNPEYW